MKNKLAIYLSVLAMLFVVSSCFNDDDDSVNNPYAYIKSFSVGDITSLYPVFTETGKDTVATKTISGSSFPFTIDHAACEIYNSDSLPFKTNLSKVLINMSVEGVATIYSEENDAYEYFTLEDSIDFTTPRKFRITSQDGSYSNYYTVSVNAHQVEPDLMVWKRVSGSVSLNPQKAVEFDGKVYVFGTLADRTPVMVCSEMDATISWSSFARLGLPLSVDFSTLHLFKGVFYVLADGDLYASADALTWESVSQGNGFVAIIGASDQDGRMWLAGGENIFCTEDAVSFEAMGALPKGLPLCGLSTSSYALSHNKGIIRYMLVGYTTAEKDGAPKVWSMLSTENKWVEYGNVDNPYPCPALDGLVVLRYDNSLYAFGGKGTVSGEDVEAFGSFYVSRDNGIVWKAPDDFYRLLPNDIKGEECSFVAFVDSKNYMWILTDNNKVGVWRGIINRLGFKE